MKLSNQTPVLYLRDTQNPCPRNRTDTVAQKWRTLDTHHMKLSETPVLYLRGTQIRCPRSRTGTRSMPTKSVIIWIVASFYWPKRIRAARTSTRVFVI